MIKFVRLALICAGIGLVVVSSSCSSEYDPTPGVSGRDTIRNAFLGDFTAMINGVQFVANTKYFSENTVDNVRIISVSGVMDSKEKDPNNNQTISFSIYDYQGPNTYMVQGGVTATYTIKEDGEDRVYTATSTEESFITVTGDGDQIEGSFHFLVPVVDSGSGGAVLINNGHFRIPR